MIESYTSQAGAGSCHTNWQFTSLFSELGLPILTRTRMTRPKGSLSPHIRKVLEMWDAIKNDNPSLNNEALLELVADALFGLRLNVRVKKLERTKIRRILQRHKKL
jgi:hypothetical protein